MYIFSLQLASGKNRKEFLTNPIRQSNYKSEVYDQKVLKVCRKGNLTGPGSV